MDGLSNKLMGFSLVSNPKDVVMIKVYGANTELMLDRQAEIDTRTERHMIIILRNKMINVKFGHNIFPKLFVS